MSSGLENGVPRAGNLGQIFRDRKIIPVKKVESCKVEGPFQVSNGGSFDFAATARRLAEDAGESGTEAAAVLSISARLRRKFGLGDSPRKRQLLYARLEKLFELHGEAVLEVISESVCGSAGKANPGKYFCRAVCLKLQERRLWSTGGASDASW